MLGEASLFGELFKTGFSATIRLVGIAFGLAIFCCVAFWGLIFAFVATIVGYHLIPLAYYNNLSPEDNKGYHPRQNCQRGIA